MADDRFRTGEYVSSAIDNADDLVDGHHLGAVKEVDLSNEMRTAFLSYAMSVIVSRALPDVRDGMKPVHRRILYGMSELGVTNDKPTKKSARIVGEVMGKYHPHGDAAIYDSMVRMAQDFSYRYPLVDGQGNFGSVDGDGAAAMRYTEARLSKVAQELLRDLNKDTVDFQDNYDGTEREPVVLPSRFPNILVTSYQHVAVDNAISEVSSSLPAYRLFSEYTNKDYKEMNDKVIERWKDNVKTQIEQYIQEHQEDMPSLLNDKYNEFLNEINNLNNKTIDEVCKFYNNEQNKIDFSTIYYYIKTKDINNGLFGSYPKNFHLITKNKGSREEKKLFKKNVKLSQLIVKIH